MLRFCNPQNYTWNNSNESTSNSFCMNIQLTPYEPLSFRAYFAASHMQRSLVKDRNRKGLLRGGGEFGVWAGYTVLLYSMYKVQYLYLVHSTDSPWLTISFITSALDLSECVSTLTPLGVGGGEGTWKLNWNTLLILLQKYQML